MKPKVCLIRCPNITLPYPPDIGLGSLNAVLKRAGYDVRVLDLNWRLYAAADEATRDGWLWRGEAAQEQLGSTVWTRLWPRIEAEVEAALAAGVDVFGFSVWNTNEENSVSLARWIKGRSPRARVIFGGPTAMPLWGGERFKADAAIDAVAHGEAESTLLELLGGLERDGALSPCAGASVRVDGRMVSGPERGPEDIARLPYPDYSDYDVHSIDHRLAIAFNRGCVWRCKFCSVPGYIPKFRWRPAAQIFDEVRHQIGRYGIRDFYEFSPATNSNMKQVLEFCGLVAENKLEVRWEGFGIFLPSMTTEAISELKRGGCTALSFGLESGSQRILDRMEKRFRVADAERILRDLRRAGIRTFVSTMVGYPGETEADFQETMAFVERNAENLTEVASTSVFVMDPYARVARDLPGFQNGDDDPSEPTNTRQAQEERLRRLRAHSLSLGLWTDMKHPRRGPVVA